MNSGEVQTGAPQYWRDGGNREVFFVAFLAKRSQKHGDNPEFRWKMVKFGKIMEKWMGKHIHMWLWDFFLPDPILIIPPPFNVWHPRGGPTCPMQIPPPRALKSSRNIKLTCGGGTILYWKVQLKVVCAGDSAEDIETGDDLEALSALLWEADVILER